MPDTNYYCPKCRGPMARGFVAERGGSSGRFVATWVEGEPVNREIFGLKGDNLEIHNRMQFAVRSLRCGKCGFLELYAV